MKPAAIKFLVLVFMLTIICAVGQWLWNEHTEPKMRLPDGYYLLGIFAVTVSMVHLFLLSAKTGGGKSFIQVFMLSTTLKFFFYLTVLAVFMLFTKDNKLALAVHFLLYYFVFNVLEISMLYAEMQKK